MTQLNRRRFLIRSMLATIGMGTGTGLYAWQVEPHWLEFVNRRLPIRGLPPVLEGARLVQLSDLHVGRRVSNDYILETFRRVTALEPDIVVFTGDFTSYHPDVFAQSKRIYARTPLGRLGTVGILGNHDYGPNWDHTDVAAWLTEMLSSVGIRILRNEVTEVAGLQIVGFDDLWAGEFKPAEAWRSLQPGKAALALSHNPDTVDAPVWEPFSGWILSGHTHGGQCKPPFLPPPLLPVRNKRYTSGVFELPGGRTMYISRGVGHLLQVRFNVRPEVTVFELTSGWQDGHRPAILESNETEKGREQAAHLEGA